MHALPASAEDSGGPPQLAHCPATTRSAKPLGSQLGVSSGHLLSSLHLCGAWKLQAESRGGERAWVSCFLSLRDCCPSWARGQCPPNPGFSILPAILIFSGKGQLVPVTPRLDEETVFNFLNLYVNDFPANSAGKESACNAGDLSSVPGSERSSGKGIGHPLQYSWASLVAQLVKNLPAVRETCVQSLGWEDPLE